MPRRKLTPRSEPSGAAPAEARVAIDGAPPGVEVVREPFPDALEPFLDAFADLIVEDLLATHPAVSKP
jgi:hypothetical protein